MRQMNEFVVEARGYKGKEATDASPLDESGAWRVVDLGFLVEDDAVEAAEELVNDGKAVEARVYLGVFKDANGPPTGADKAREYVRVTRTGTRWEAWPAEAPKPAARVDPYAHRVNGVFGAHIRMELTDKNRKPRGPKGNEYGSAEVPTHHPLEQVLVHRPCGTTMPRGDNSVMQMQQRIGMHVDGLCKSGVRAFVAVEWFEGTREAFEREEEARAAGAAAKEV